MIIDNNYNSYYNKVFIDDCGHDNNNDDSILFTIIDRIH